MSDFKIQKGIPIPSSAVRGSGLKYPFAEMVEGDSFFVSADDMAGATLAKLRNTLGAAVSKFKKLKQPTWRFTVAADPLRNGVRVWRLADQEKK